jgi:hypothetical protein
MNIHETCDCLVLAPEDVMAPCKIYEEIAAGAKAQSFFCGICGTTEVVP